MSEQNDDLDWDAQAAPQAPKIIGTMTVRFKEEKMSELKKCGAAIIAAERTRQIEMEQWSHGHDLQHDGKEIAEAARCCLQSYVNGVGRYWPLRFNDTWGLGKKHNNNPERLLAIAGALIAAELDRINGTINKGKV